MGKPSGMCGLGESDGVVLRLIQIGEVGYADLMSARLMEADHEEQNFIFRSVHSVGQYVDVQTQPHSRISSTASSALLM